MTLHSLKSTLAHNLLLQNIVSPALECDQEFPTACSPLTTTTHRLPECHYNTSLGQQALLQKTNFVAAYLWAYFKLFFEEKQFLLYWLSVNSWTAESGFRYFQHFLDISIMFLVSILGIAIKWLLEILEISQEKFERHWEWNYWKLSSTSRKN